MKINVDSRMIFEKILHPMGIEKNTPIYTEYSGNNFDIIDDDYNIFQYTKDDYYWSLDVMLSDSKYNSISTNGKIINIMNGNKLIYENILKHAGIETDKFYYLVFDDEDVKRSPEDLFMIDSETHEVKGADGYPEDIDIFLYRNIYPAEEKEGNEEKKNETAEKILNELLNRWEKRYSIEFSGKERKEQLQAVTDNISEEEYEMDDILFTIMMYDWIRDSESDIVQEKITEKKYE